MDYEQDYLGPNSSSLEVMIKEEEEETMDPLYQKRITLEHRAPPPAAARPPPVATGSPANAYLIQRCVLDQCWVDPDSNWLRIHRAVDTHSFFC